jgi:hypothetical protein
MPVAGQLKAETGITRRLAGKLEEPCGSRLGVTCLGFAHPVRVQTRALEERLAVQPIVIQCLLEQQVGGSERRGIHACTFRFPFKASGTTSRHLPIAVISAPPAILAHTMECID